MLRPVGMLAFANLAIFFVMSSWFGGDAGAGHEAAGHYYLGNHGTMTEVSRDVFRYSEVHVAIASVNFALAFALVAASAALHWLMILTRPRTKL